MLRIIPWIVLPMFLMAISPGSDAAEEVKLKPVISVYKDGNGGKLNQPEGVGCDDRSHVVVADSGNGRLLSYSFKDGKINPDTEIGLPQLPYPIKVQVDSKGEFLVLDGKLRKIARLSPGGEFRGYIEPTGPSSAGSFVPRNFRIDSQDNMFILDVDTGRVLVLDPGGKFVREIPFPEKHGFFSDIAVAPNGNIYLIDSVGRRVFSSGRGSSSILPLTEEWNSDMNFPTSIAADAKGHLFVVDQTGGGVVILGQDGSFAGRPVTMGWKEGFLRYPSQICINKQGTVFVADRGNNRLQIFSLNP